MTTDPCPCGEPRSLAECCEPIIDGERQAMTARELMRSRYTAYSLGPDAPEAVEHLLRSWDPDTRPISLDLEERNWTGLTIHGFSRGGALDSSGTVDFTATYEEDGEPRTQAENSSFRRVNSRWAYTAGLL